MGLLDNLMNSSDGLLGLSLLDAAGPSAVPRSFGQRLFSGLQTAKAVQQAEEDRRQKAALQGLQSQLMQAQIGDVQSQAQQRAAQAAQLQQQARRAQAFQQAIAQQLGGTSPQQALAGGGGPTQQNAAQIGQQQPMNWQALAAQYPDQLDLIKKLAESNNFGRNKVARTIEGKDAQGRPVTYSVDDYNNPIGTPIQQWKAPQMVDTGGAIGALDPVSMQMLQQFKKTQTPDGQASNAVAWSRLAFDKSKDAADRANPAGGNYEYKQDAAGNWMALPKQPTPGAPIQPLQVAAPNKNAQGANDALAIINMAKPLIDKATNSFLGRGADLIGQLFGASSQSADAAAQLKALEGALMMKQPRMEGPQSDKDALLYRQMAGQIGDPTVPASQKHAALKVIEQLHERYATSATPSSGQRNITVDW